MKTARGSLFALRGSRRSHVMVPRRGSSAISFLPRRRRLSLRRREADCPQPFSRRFCPRRPCFVNDMWEIRTDRPVREASTRFYRPGVWLELHRELEAGGGRAVGVHLVNVALKPRVLPRCAYRPCAGRTRSTAPLSAGRSCSRPSEQHGKRYLGLGRTDVL